MKYLDSYKLFESKLSKEEIERLSYDVSDYLLDFFDNNHIQYNAAHRFFKNGGNSWAFEEDDGIKDELYIYFDIINSKEELREKSNEIKSMKSSIENIIGCPISISFHFNSDLKTGFIYLKINWRSPKQKLKKFFKSYKDIMPSSSDEYELREIPPVSN